MSNSTDSTDKIKSSNTDFLTLPPVTTGDEQSGSPLTSPNFFGPAVGGAVGALLVVVAITAVVVVVLLFIKRGQKGSLKVNDGKESVQGFNNAVYDGKQNTQTDK